MDTSSIATHILGQYTVTTSCLERAIYINITNNTSYMCYEGTFDIAVFQTQFNIATVFKLLNKCFDGTLNYKVRFELEKGTLQLLFDCLMDGFLEIGFVLRLYEKTGSEKEMKLIAEIEELKKRVTELESETDNDSVPENKDTECAASGLVKISDALAEFLGKEKGSVVLRREVSEEIREYVKRNNLGTGRFIYPDTKLASLLVPNCEQLTYFNMRHFMDPHFMYLPKQPQPIPNTNRIYPCIDSLIGEAVIDNVKYTLFNVKFGERTSDKWFRVELVHNMHPMCKKKIPHQSQQEQDNNVYLIGDITAIRHLINNSYTFYNGAKIVTQYPPLMYPLFKMEDGRIVVQNIGNRFENGGFVTCERTFETRQWCDFTYLNAEKVMNHFKI